MRRSARPARAGRALAGVRTDCFLGLGVNGIATTAGAIHNQGMAKTPPDIAAAIATLGTKVNFILGVGAVAIGAGAWVSYDIATRLGDLQQVVGRVDGQNSVLGQLEQINETLKSLRSAPPQTPPAEILEKKKQTLLEPTAGDFPGWTGVRAENSAALEKALPLAEKKDAPVWVYTPDEDMADTLRKALE